MSGIEASPPDIVEVPELDPEVVPAHVQEEVDGVLELGRVDGYEAAGYYRSRTSIIFLVICDIFSPLKRSRSLIMY